MTLEEHLKAVEDAVAAALDDGFYLESDSYTGALYLKGYWNNELQHYDRHYLWDND